jgi:hypothetical protein
VNANSGLVGVSLTSTYINLTTTNTYVAAGTWSDATANAILTGTPTNINTSNPGATWTMIATGTPYVLSSYNAQLYSPNSATASTPYSSAASVFGSTSGYTYQIVYNSQVGSTTTTRVFVSKGTAPYYNSYNFNTFTFTNTAGSDALFSSITSSNGVLSYDGPNPLTISADGATQSVYLRMSGSTIQYSTDNQVTWNNITIGNWPVTFTNSNPTPGPSSLLRVIATQALTISSSYGNTSGYFIAGSSYVTFDGSGNTININSITSYPGLIQNGTSTANGFANVVVQNFTTAISGSTLATEAGWICQSYFGKGILGNQITGCLNTGSVNANYAGGIVGAYAGSTGGLLNITNCSNIGTASLSFTGGVAGYRFAYNTSNTCAITSCYSTGLISGSNAGGIVGADVGYNDNALYTPVVNITNSYSLGTIATTCGGICGGTDGGVYTNTPTITITNCYSSGTIVNPNSGIVSTSYPKTTTQTNVYAAEGRAWVNDTANANLTGTPTNFNTPGSTWTMVAPGNPYVLSLYNAQLYSPSSASGITTYTSPGSVFGSSSGYTYIIININQVANVATTKVFAYKGSVTSPYAYNYNTFTFTDTNGVSAPGKMSSSIGSVSGVLTITKRANNISADGSGNSIYLQMSGSSMQYSVGSTPGAWTTISTWPMTLTNSNPGPTSVLRVVATQALTISSSTGGTNGFFIAGSPYITFDGSGNTITINAISSYPGLIQNGSTTAGTNGFVNIVVQNFTTAMSSSSIATYAGWLCQPYFGRNVSGNAITNCTNNASPNTSYAAGIVGEYAGSYGGSLTITGCTNAGNFVSNDYTGGIAAQYAGSFGGSASFINCTNTGTTVFDWMWYGGGITSFYAGSDGGSVTITNCSNTANINQYAGGIVGAYLGNNGGSATITNCINTGTIQQSVAGGIVGSSAGQINGLVTITNCYSTGAIIGTNAGGIAGQSFANNTSRNCVISECYVIGTISGSNAGGITGASVGFSNNALYTASVNISNSYSLGNIATTCGGICGGSDGSTYINKANIRISNSYSYGTLTGTGAGLVGATLTSANINLTTPNTYVAAGTWSDASANASLTSGTTPTNINTNNPGSTWTMVASGTPYILSSYNAQLYSPNNATASTPYTSAASVFGSTSGYTYQIVYNSQLGSTATTRVFVSKGTAPYYNSYNFNTFAFTNTAGSDTLFSSITSSNGALSYDIPNPLTISVDGSGNSVYLRMSSGLMQYSIDNQVTWNNITIGNWPVTFINSNPTPGPTNVLRVTATQALTITSGYGNTLGYFIAGSSYVTFDGSGNTINMNTITSYPGFIQNGTSSANGYANIVVQNFTTAISSSTLATEAGWLGQSYFGKGVLGNEIMGCTNTGTLNANYAGGIVGAYAGSSGGLLNITNCSNIGIASSSFTGGIAGYRFGYNTSNTCVISGCYSTGSISGSNAGGIVGADVGYNDNVLYTPVVNITNSYSLGTIATTCGGICGGTDAIASYINTPIITITNCYSYGTIVNANSGIVSTSYPKATIQSNVYAAQGAWSDATASGVLTGTPTNLNTGNPGSTWTTIVSGTPYVLSLYNAQLYNPNSASSSSTYTSAPGLFQPGYTYQIVYSSQSTNVLTIRAFVSKGTAPYYNSYNFNTFTFTNSGVVSTTLIPSIESSTGVLVIGYPLTISADGSGNSVYLRMIGSIMEYSIGSVPGSYTPIASTEWPVIFTNSNPGASILRVAATMALTISNTYGNIVGYFIAGSSNVTFDGSGNTINMNSIASYPGFIQNGTSTSNGYASVVVKNFTTATSGSVLATNAGWMCQSYFGKGTLGNEIMGCTNTGAVNANYAGGIVGAYAGSSGGLLNITNCSNIGIASSLYTGGIAGYRFGYNTSNTSVISGSYSTGSISGSNAGGIVGADVGYNDNALYTPVVNITNSYSLGAIASTCGGICGGTDGGAYTNSPTITITNCFSSGTIVNASSGIVSTSYPKPTTQTNVYAAQGAWVNDTANANLTGTPTNFNSPGSTWTSVDTSNPYVLSLYNAQLYSPSSASSVTPYTSAGSVFGSVSGYTYIIININQVANVATTKVFAFKGTAPNYYSYNYNTFTLTDTNGISSPGKMSSSIGSTTGVLTITKSANNISADGSGNSINLRMSGASLQYSVVGSAPVDWTTISTWPMTLTNSNSNPGPSSVLRVVATQALSISSSTGGTNGFFIAGSPYITFDGSGNTITISSIPSYTGLIENGSTTAGTNGFANIVVQNFITTISGTSSLAGSAGWLCRQYFGRNVSGNAITGCTNNGTISGTSSGGIAGIGGGSLGGSITFMGCTNNGNASVSRASGIAGENVGRGGSATFTGCINTGVISGSASGGITGLFAGFAGSATFTSCTNTGVISGSQSGGIAGPQAAQQGGSISLTNCFSSGLISGQSAGSIIGSYAGFTNGLVNLTNCFSTGLISGRYAGGIAGIYFACNSSRNCVISQCYSTLDISGNNAGGIVGADVGYNNNALYTPNVNITNCYSLGAISTTAGGICGGTDTSAYTNNPTITITNCYSSGTIVDPSSGIVSVLYPKPTTQINTYVAAGTWTDASANDNLTGTPTSIALRSSSGTTWTSISANIPYFLTSFFSIINSTQIYTPDNVSTFTNYTSSPGLYSPGIYSILSSSQSGATITVNVAAAQGTSPTYYGYYNNIFTLTNLNGGTGRPISVTINESTGVLDFILPYPCFLEGTKILCFENEQEVYRPIETLRKGDLVKTTYNGYKPIHMIGTTSLYNPGNDYRITNRLYKCSREKYPALFEDLYITGCHSILVPWMTDDQWENTKAVNGDIFVTDNHFRLIACADEKAEPFNKEGFVNIYHVALEHDDYFMNYGIYANGLLVESCSKRYLTEISNMRILGQEDCPVSENVDKVPFNMGRQLVDTY